MRFSTDPSNGNQKSFFAQIHETAMNVLFAIQSSGTTTDNAAGKVPTPAPAGNEAAEFTRQRFAKMPELAKAFWERWYIALKNILPIYIAVHLAFAVATYFSFLFVFPAYSPNTMPIRELLKSWARKDTAHYVWIATHGYTDAWRTAFFPLYPLLERFLMVFTHGAFNAGLIISNLAGLIMLMVLYRLVLEDFDHEHAYRTVLYLSIFPTAFFFASAYNESLFLCLSVLSFYHMRHRQWWLAGLFGLLASLTRSTGLLLFVPFCYEYLRQRHFSLKTFLFNALSGILIPAGTALFALYCYIQFQDPLAFSHAQAVWHRKLEAPWVGIFLSISDIVHSGGLISFTAIRNIFELGLVLFILTLIVLSFVGPWKFPRNMRSYSIYAAVAFLFLLLFPVIYIYPYLFPLGSNPRFLLELFPAFIVLAAIGRNQTFNMIYLMTASAMLFLFLVEFLTGTWLT